MKNKKNEINIIGGGISGLYLVYKLSKNKNNLINLFEKENRYGGRIYTDDFYKTKIERGAGRFNKNHKLIKKLIIELGLKNKISKIGSKIEYKTNNENEKNMKMSDILNKLYRGLNKINRFKLMKYNLIYFGNKILKKDEVQYLKNSFGYYTELTKLPAIMSYKMIKNDLYSDVQYYNLKDGLNQIVNEIYKKIKKMENVKIHKNSECIKIEKDLEIYIKNTKNGKIKKYRSDKLILGIPKPNILKIEMDKKMKLELEKKLKKIECSSLFRIYSKIDLKKLDENDIKKLMDIKKTTTKEDIRYIIPINLEKGIIMSSYTDNGFADKMNRKLKKNGKIWMNKYLEKELSKVLDIKNLKIKESRFYYWKCGMAIRKPGSKIGYEKEMEQLINPIKGRDIYISGENISLNQGWIEGALNTSEKVIKKLK